MEPNLRTKVYAFFCIVFVGLGILSAVFQNVAGLILAGFLILISRTLDLEDKLDLLMEIEEEKALKVK